MLQQDADQNELEFLENMIADDCSTRGPLESHMHAKQAGQLDRILHRSVNHMNPASHYVTQTSHLCGVPFVLQARAEVSVGLKVFVMFADAQALQKRSTSCNSTDESTAAVASGPSLIKHTNSQ